MAELSIPSGTILRNDSAVFRFALVSDDSREFIDPAEIVRLQADLYIVSPLSRLLSSWVLNVDDVMTDGPVFHAQDGGWPFTTQGYNLKWELPSGHTDKAPGHYRVAITCQLTGLRQATVLADLKVSDPVSYA